MWDRLLFLTQRLREKLWARPLFLCVLSVGAAFVAKAADRLDIESSVPGVASDSIETLLSITAGSMLVIATLAVASMVAAYSSASNAATPRSFSLLVSDDLSQNALSTFLGAFIFTFVALVALKNGYYGRSGLFVLFVMTVFVVATVIVTFVRWVDWIARLGRIGTTVDKVEDAGLDAFRRRRRHSRLGGAPIEPPADGDDPVHGDKIGYVQHVNVGSLQEIAEEHDVHILVTAVPGVFVAPGRELVYVRGDVDVSAIDAAEIVDAFDIGDTRSFHDDPRFSLVALSEIASRALSPAVNDPGTAIGIFGSFVRMFSVFSEPPADDDSGGVKYDRVLIPELAVDDMLDDAFRAIARDGAGIVEVQIRLQKALEAIATMPDPELSAAAKRQSRAALERARQAMTIEVDIALVAAAAEWSE